MASPLDPLTTVYSRLPINAEDEIRLLLLHATKPDDGIECSLVVRRREHVFDKYFSLSYTWGESDRRQTITVNDVPGVPVTDNLFAALKRLRDLNSFKPRVFWIDALCINQADSIERSLQVQRMREVYHSADRVLVWLGDSDYLENHPAAGNYLKDEWFRQSLHQAVRHTAPSWWERIWVWQEFAAARKPPVFCFGRVKTESMEFKKLLQSLHKQSVHTKEPSSFASSNGGRTRSRYVRTAVEHIASLKTCVDNLETLRANKKESLNLPFAEVLKQTAEAEATDPRDRIFSLVGFLKPEIADILKPDYTRSMGTVCAAATYAYMLEMGVTAALSRVRLSLTQFGECPKPSWAIAFDTHPDFGEYTPNSPFACFHAALQDASSSSGSLHFDSDGNSLKLLGSRFDRICEVVDHFSFELPPKYNGLFAKFMTVSKKAKKTETYLDDPAYDDANELDRSLRDQYMLPNTPGSNPFMSISPIEAAVRNPSYRPFLVGSTPEDQSRRIRRELKSMLDLRRAWMSGEWKEWNEEFENKVHEVRNEWDLHNAEIDTTPHMALLEQLREASKDAENSPGGWSKRLNFGLYHYTDDKTICPVNFMRYADAAMGRSVVFITDAGFVGVAPSSISQGDIVTMLSGSTMPVILRQVEDHYTFQGLAYVLDIMHGEMCDVVLDANTKLEHETLELR